MYTIQNILFNLKLQFKVIPITVKQGRRRQRRDDNE